MIDIVRLFWHFYIRQISFQQCYCEFVLAMSKLLPPLLAMRRMYFVECLLACIVDKGRFFLNLTLNALMVCVVVYLGRLAVYLGHSLYVFKWHSG
jgi:hypothetical protein